MTMKSTLKTTLGTLLATVLALALSPASQASDWDVQPSIKKSFSPDNPNKSSGLVMAQIEINEKGRATGASIAKSTDESLDPHVLEAVKKWLFKPAKKGGSPVASKIHAPFKFEG